MWLDQYPSEFYEASRIKEAYLILHPQILERYDITREEFYDAFPRASNFSQLKYPIVDEYWIEYWDSEWYYMSQRVESLTLKRKISEASKVKGQSKKQAYKYKELLNQNEQDRIEFMRNAITQKYNGSKWRNAQLLETGNREIIEFTYWWDEFFWISNTTRTGRNILGKLIMEYRDDLLARLNEYA